MRAPTKILVYSHDWFPLLGGVQTVTLSLATGLAAWEKSHPGESFEVVFVTDTRADGMDDSAFHFRVVRCPRIREFLALLLWADVIDLAGPSLLPLVLAKLLGKPTVLEHHGYQAVCPNGLLVFGPRHNVCPGYFMAGRYGKCVECNEGEMGLAGSVRKLLLTFPRRWLAKKATVNVGVSPYVADRVELPRTVAIWNGVTASPKPLSNEELGVDSPPICFGYLGRLVTEKGLPVLLRASRELAAKGYQFRLRIVGDGPERRNLVTLSQEYGLADRTEFVGPVPASAIRQTLHGVSIVVIPSVWEDVAPLVAIEQMMEGRLLIASDIGGLGLIANGGGLKFQAGDAVELEARMRQILEKPSTIPEMAARCRQHALETFSLERMVGQHVEIYRTISEGR